MTKPYREGQLTYSVHDDSDAALVRLCRVGAAALSDEETRLNLAFAGTDGDLRAFYKNTPSQNDGRSGATNQGLAYWLYETTLVYVIFRSWIPLAPVVWDADRRNAEGKKEGAVDLTIRAKDEHGSYRSIKWAFEAKYWMNDTNTALDAILKDVSKLERFSAERRFVLAFWHTSQFDADDANVKKTADEHGWQRVFSGRFPCHHGTDPGRFFVMDVLDVTTVITEKG